MTTSPPLRCPSSISVDAGEFDPTPCILTAGHSCSHVGTLDGYDTALRDRVRVEVTWQSKPVGVKP